MSGAVACRRWGGASTAGRGRDAEMDSEEGVRLDARIGDRAMGAGGTKMSEVVSQTKGDESHSSVKLYWRWDFAGLAVMKERAGSWLGFSLVFGLSRASFNAGEGSRGGGSLAMRMSCRCVDGEDAVENWTDENVRVPGTGPA